MKPKEKAKQIFDDMLSYHPPFIDQRIEIIEAVKQCALIAVDEMIEQQQIQAENMVWSCVEYWKQVKQEIEKRNNITGEYE